ncbi:hypothetical protein BN439_2892 [Erwinia amylovora Ea644]|nr:hypothetical protein BN439_2892 [Erwinia amylovora Ea644]
MCHLSASSVTFFPVTATLLVAVFMALLPDHWVNPSQQSEKTHFYCYPSDAMFRLKIFSRDAQRCGFPLTRNYRTDSVTLTLAPQIAYQGA